MRYTQSQVRDVLSLTLQTYRYWAAAVPHLASRTGKAATFSAGDILGLAFTKEACVGMEASVSRLKIGLDAMFVTLNGTPWPSIEGCVLALAPDRAEFLSLQDLVGHGGLTGPTLIIPCLPVMDALRARLLPDGAGQRDPQAHLPLLGRAPPGKSSVQDAEAGKQSPRVRA